MQTIRKYDFALYDLALYLDTHTQCREALRLYKQYLALRKAAVEEYTTRFGPIDLKTCNSDHEWAWVKSPYPWEREAN